MYAKKRNQAKNERRYCMYTYKHTEEQEID